MLVSRTSSVVDPVKIFLSCSSMTVHNLVPVSHIVCACVRRPKNLGDARATPSCNGALLPTRNTSLPTCVTRPIWSLKPYWHQSINQSISQFNSNLAAREPDSKWYAVEIIDKNSIGRGTEISGDAGSGPDGWDGARNKALPTCYDAEFGRMIFW